MRIAISMSMLLLLPVAALAHSVNVHHGAPAPLLAAGLPAFVALGGGAGILRLLRGRKGTPRTEQGLVTRA